MCIVAIEMMLICVGRRGAIPVPTATTAEPNSHAQFGLLAEREARALGPGDITDDNDLPGMSDAMLGVVTAGFYSAYHQSAVEGWGSGRHDHEVSILITGVGGLG